MGDADQVTHLANGGSLGQTGQLEKYNVTILLNGHLAT